MRRIALLCMLLSGGLSLLWASYIVHSSPGGLVDFKAYYYGARCLIEHRDPYKEAVFLDVYRTDGGVFPSDPTRLRSLRRAIPVCINLPTSLFLIAPLALLPWRAAAIFWMLLEFVGLILAGHLTWDITCMIAGNNARGIFLALICNLVANSELLFSGGNFAGIVVSLCIFALWCFLKERFIPAGVLCLAASLSMKPHDVGFIWLYLLLAGGRLRRPALQTLLVASLLCLPAVLWVSHAAPHWLPELRFNLLSTSLHGDINDPGPTSLSAHLAGSILDLQSVISLFRDDPHIYNPLSYLICGALLLAGLVRAVVSRFSTERALLAIAAIVPLSMLITYHRPYDAKLLLLTVPACAILWTRGGAVGRFALSITAAAIVLTGDLFLAILTIFTRSLPSIATSWFALVQSLIVLHASTLVLLLMGIFYLWFYIKASSENETHRAFGLPQAPPAQYMNQPAICTDLHG